MNNILIIFAHAIDPTSGGVERVYHNLAPSLIKNGFRVYVTYNALSDYDKRSVYNDIFYTGNLVHSPRKYVKRIQEIIIQKMIDIIICPFSDYRFLKLFSRQKSLKIFFHIHNVPSKLMYPSPSFIPSFLKGTAFDEAVRHFRMLIRYYVSFRRIDKYGMKVVLLSDGHRKNLESFYKFNSQNIVSIANPIPMDDVVSIRNLQKEKIILYVGRINTEQKRLQSLLNIWAKVQNRLPEYKLEVVGGGVEKKYYEDKAKDMELKRITFYGFQNPEEYYKKAMVSCMTSNYEGFGMVLVEAMKYGCVPFAFDSFASLPDIIDNGKNGYVIHAFDEDQYAETLVKFVNLNNYEQETIRENCLTKAKLFSVDVICKKWIKIINEYGK